MLPAFYRKTILSFMSVVLSVWAWQMPAIISAQESTGNMIVRVNNIAAHGELSVRGLTANFPYPILTTISVTDTLGTPINGLADTSRWLGPDDIAEIGVPVSTIWKPMLEYYQADSGSPINQDVYQQIPAPLITEIPYNDPTPTSTMMVMDVSGSMADEIEDAKDAARFFVRSLRSSDRAGIIQFSEKIEDYQAVTGDTTLLMAAIDRAEKKSRTAMFLALMNAIEGIKGEPGRRGIIIYADGGDNASAPITIDDVIDSAKAYNIPIYTIALGTVVIQMNLRQIADETGGIFFKATTAQDLKPIYLNYLRQLQSYYVMAHSSPDPNSDNRWRVVDVTVDPGDSSGTGRGKYIIPESVATDIALTLAAETDTAVVIDDIEKPATLPGNAYRYTINLANRSISTGDTMTLVQFLPDSVQFLNANPAPNYYDRQMVVWRLKPIAGGNQAAVLINVKLAKPIPGSIHQLFSNAHIFVNNDSDLSNNAAHDTVNVLVPLDESNFDIVLRHSATTDTSINGTSGVQKAVMAGNSYTYDLTIENFGPGDATSVRVVDHIPDSVTVANFSPPPAAITADSIVWNVPVLLHEDSLHISWSATVADTLPVKHFPLMSIAAVTAARDTIPENNSASALVYGLRHKRPVTDLSVSLVALTDTAIVIGSDSTQAIWPGDEFQYRIRVNNPGNHVADSVVVSQSLPDSLFYLSSSVTPLAVNDDSLLWVIDRIRNQAVQDILVTVQAADSIPSGFRRMVSAARIKAEQDMNPANNMATEVVQAITVIDTTCNLSIQQKAITPRSIRIAGKTVPSVLRSDTYQYTLTVQNHGPGKATAFAVWALQPDSISLNQFSLNPAAIRADSVFWQVDSLHAGDSLVIAMQANVADGLPFSPFTLNSSSGVDYSADSDASDNRSGTTVYATYRPDDLHPANEFVDIAVKQTAITDSIVVTGADTVRFANTGNTYTYRLIVQNLGTHAARDVVITDLFPGEIQPGGLAPDYGNMTSTALIWNPGYLQPQQSIQLTFLATVSETIPIGRNLLINQVTVSAANETASALANNTSIDTVQNIQRPPQWQPLIQAEPSLVQVGDMVNIQVQVLQPVVSWDLWVHHANGEIDSSYADDFISITQLQAGQWYAVDPGFSNTLMVTNSEQEPIRFEFRTVDIFGDFRNVETSVTLQSANDFTVDRNVFNPSRENDIPIRFKLSSNRSARLDIFDITGTKISTLAEAPFAAGWNTYSWDGRTSSGQQIGSGFYIITINSGGYSAWKKLFIVQ